MPVFAEVVMRDLPPECKKYMLLIWYFLQLSVQLPKPWYPLHIKQEDSK